ncbi:MAG: hypothetical protein CMJ48_10590, partial [Planctomycetaceae bacterium]|nr:hypothetical protein [Planctomycetaceae bacterium]
MNARPTPLFWLIRKPPVETASVLQTLNFRSSSANLLSRVEEISRTVMAAPSRMSKPWAACPARDQIPVALCLWCARL